MTEEKLEPNDNIALIDMDGTLFDYDGRMREELKKIRSPYEPEIDDIADLWDESLVWLKQRMRLIKSQVNFWRHLPKFQLGWDVYEILKELEFDCQILTKGPSSLPTAWAEKMQCVTDHFGETISVNMTAAGKETKSKNKDKSNNYGRVLVDDYPEYVLNWLSNRPRGLVIMPAHPYNANFKHENVVRYDGTNLKEVRDHLVAVSKRNRGQHWRETFNDFAA